jgi:hypothetical protein
VLSALAGLGYVIDNTARVLLSGYDSYADLFLLVSTEPSIVGELAFLGWLLARGSGSATPSLRPEASTRFGKNRLHLDLYTSDQTGRSNACSSWGPPASRATRGRTRTSWCCRTRKATCSTSSTRADRSRRGLSGARQVTLRARNDVEGTCVQ